MILRNSAICDDCNQEIVSRFRHDYVECECGKTAVDGGLAYLKRSGNLTETSLTTESPFEQIRNGFEWGTRGKSGKEKLKYVKLKDLEFTHIDAIIKWQKLPPELLAVFEKDLQFRLTNTEEKQW